MKDDLVECRPSSCMGEVEGDAHEVGLMDGTPNWSNQTIWTGDNLPIMRGMNSSPVDTITLIRCWLSASLHAPVTLR